MSSKKPWAVDPRPMFDPKPGPDCGLPTLLVPSAAPDLHTGHPHYALRGPFVQTTCAHSDYCAVRTNGTIRWVARLSQTPSEIESLEGSDQSTAWLVRGASRLSRHCVLDCWYSP